MGQKPFLRRCFLFGKQSYPVLHVGWLLVAARAARLVVHLDTAWVRQGYCLTEMLVTKRLEVNKREKGREQPAMATGFPFCHGAELGLVWCDGAAVRPAGRGPWGGGGALPCCRLLGIIPLQGLTLEALAVNLNSLPKGDNAGLQMALDFLKGLTKNHFPY